MTRRLAIIGLSLAAAALVATLRPARAATATSTLRVQANVLGSCTIAPATLDFGNYDPNLATDHDVTSNIVVQCTAGTTYWLNLGPGNNFSAPYRRMAGGTGEFLNYQLYTNALGGTIWDNTNGVHIGPVGGGAGLSARNIPIYGRVFAQQVVSGGAFIDDVTMTLNF